MLSTSVLTAAFPLNALATLLSCALTGDGAGVCDAFALTGAAASLGADLAAGFVTGLEADLAAGLETDA